MATVQLAAVGALGADTSKRHHRRFPPSLVVAAIAACGVVVSLGFTLVVPMVPMFPALLGTTAGNASWMATATVLSGAVATPLAGRLGDMYGKRRILLASLALLLAGSLLCAVSPSLAPLLVGRALQGTAAGVLPLGISILRDELPPERVNAGIGLISATLGLGAGLGLLLGGFIVDHLHWQMVFWVSAAMGALVIGAVLLVVPESPLKTGGRFDLVGAAGLSVVLVTTLLPLSKGHEWGWHDPVTLGLLVPAPVLACLWALHQSRRAHPFVDLRVTASRPVLLTNLAALVLGFAGLANLMATAEIMQAPVSTGYGFGASLTTVGLCLLPGTLVFLLLSPLSARLSTARGPHVTLAVGAFVISCGYVARILMTERIWQIVVATLVLSVGTALTYSALPTLIVRNVPESETAAANGLNALMRAIGTAAASAAFAAVLGAMTTTVDGRDVPSFTAFIVYYGIAGVAALAAVALATAIPARAAR
jgi:MFS family permease